MVSEFADINKNPSNTCNAKTVCILELGNKVTLIHIGSLNMKTNEQLRAELESRLDLTLNVRLMFNAQCLFHKGNMFAIASNGRYAIKENVDVKKIQNIAEYFVYRRGGQDIAISYKWLPESLTDDEIKRFLKIGLNNALKAADEENSEKKTLIRKLPNLGLRIEQRLAQAGINTQEELFGVGAREAYALISKEPNPKLLKQLCGAIEGKHWSLVTL